MSLRTLHPFIPTALNLLAIGSSVLYLRSHLTHNLEEQEARLDEIEGTLRGHIGLVEDALDRFKGKPNVNKQGELYGKRARDEKEMRESRREEGRREWGVSRVSWKV